jgi:hypothetical protein
MTPNERLTLTLAVAALRDVGETLVRLHEAMGRTLGLANSVLDRAEGLLAEERTPNR